MEKLNEINVMEGIDFKLNQRLSKIDDEIRIMKKKQQKKERLKSILLTIILILATAITIMLCFIIFKDDKKNIDDCIAKGYTKAYCEKSIYGL